MNIPSPKFSIYPNTQTRIATHVLFWLLIFSYALFTYKGVFTAGMLDAPVLVYSVIITLVVLVNHYFLSYLTLTFLQGKKWLFPFCIFLIYIFSVYVTITPLGFLSRAFPEYPVLKLLHERYCLRYFSDFFSYRSIAWFTSFIVFFNILTFLLKFIKNYHETNQDKILLIKEKNQMELNFLRSQIQPHFLFNTLNNIYGLVIDNDKASQSIIKLSDLLRFSLYESSLGSISLEREVLFLTDYITLEQMRHKSDRVNIDFDFGNIDVNNLKIKPLLLVNFIENAFKHGVNANINYSWVNIILIAHKNVVTFVIKNNKPPKSSRQGKQEKGVGLSNVRRRLELEYPERHSLNIKETLEVYEVNLTLRIDE